MKCNRIIKMNLVMGALLLAIAGCSSGPLLQEFSSSAIPSEEVAKLEKNIQVAQENQVNVLSPRNFKEANDFLSDAQESLAKGKENEKTLHDVASGNAYLAVANSSSVVARGLIEDVTMARKAAIAEGAKNYYAKELSNVDEDLMELTRDIEKNKLSDVQKNRRKLQSSYLDLEVKSIREANLNGSRKTIDLALKEGAKKFAPKSLAETEKSYKDSEAFIIGNRHNTSMISSKSVETKVMADKLLRINRLAKGATEAPSENIAITIEKERIARAQAQEDLVTSEGQLRETQNELANSEAALTNEANSNIALSNANQNLMTENELNEKFEDARKQFNPNEADVYKQGNKLLIRLKGLEFQTAKSNVTDKNKPLLSKVEKVLDTFGPSQVLIEGHTDSIGGKAINKKVSEKRAASVKEYLSLKMGDPGKFQSVGYDYQRPLATNKTSAGRAQNRRVDIVITPEKMNY